MPQKIVIAEIDEKGLLTGQAAEVLSEADAPYENYTTYGSWGAFQKDCQAERDL